ncbi:transposase [Capnocytophaga canis]|uniref:IS256 family transposase, variant Zn-binding type n=1 Tax=Capnocytophaga canis TaxID=1848903 RepID=UPI00370D69A2
MSKTNKKCPVCDSNHIIKKGKRNGKQRFQCGDCQANFTIKNIGVKRKNQFIWFRKWIMERQVYKTLSRDSSMSQSTLQNLFKHYLSQVPTLSIKSKTKVHLLIDGTYFSNGLCLILYYDYDIRYVQLYRQTNKEKLRDIKEDLENLKKLNVAVYSVTCDGHKSILGAVKKVFPEVIIQRCLVHIKRQIKNYLSGSPKHFISQQLLCLSKEITHLKTNEQANDWGNRFYQWYVENQYFIEEKSMNEESGFQWFKHKNLHLATYHIINALPNMFAYLQDSEIPYTTNRLEAYFTHLKEKLTLHRGLRFEAKKNFIKWYLYFKNQGG